MRQIRGWIRFVCALLEPLCAPCTARSLQIPVLEHHLTKIDVNSLESESPPCTARPSKIPTRQNPGSSQIAPSSHAKKRVGEASRPRPRCPTRARSMAWPESLPQMLKPSLSSQPTYRPTRAPSTHNLTTKLASATYSMRSCKTHQPLPPMSWKR